MADFPYLPLWTDAYLADTRHLTTREHGAYLLLMMEAWRRPNCSLPDDDVLLSRLSGLSVREWDEVKSVVMGFWKYDGRSREWTQKRLSEERIKSADKRRVAQDKAAKRWNKTEKEDAAAMQRQCTDDAIQNHNQNHKEVIEEPNGSSVVSPLDRSAECIAHFNATARQVGWPEVQKFTQPRRAALSQRIKDVGGVEGWMEAITRASNSPHLTGQNNRNWRADFDWLCKAANFTKLMEGNYDPRTGNSQRNGFPQGRPDRVDPALEQIARLTGLSQASGHGRG